MHLTKTEKNFKENVTKIIQNNRNNIKNAVKLISDMEFNKKKVGLKKAKQICNLFIEESVDFKNKYDNFDYVSETNKNFEKINI